jgi:hypothetical protein
MMMGIMQHGQDFVAQSPRRSWLTADAREGGAAAF